MSNSHTKLINQTIDLLSSKIECGEEHDSTAVRMIGLSKSALESMSNVDSNSQIEKAEMQLIGFANKSRGYSIERLIQSMGLSESEWKDIDGRELGLNSNEIKRIDDMFV